MSRILLQYPRIVLASLVMLPAAVAPAVTLTCEDYGLVYRLAENKQKPMVRLDLDASLLGEQPAFNTIAVIKGTEKLVLPRYLPVNKGEAPHYLLFCDVDGGKIDPYRAVPIKGESTVAYALAFAQAVERAWDVEVPARAIHLRALMAELERLANHFGDIGAVCNDASFAIMHAQCGILREHTLRTADHIMGLA